MDQEVTSETNTFEHAVDFIEPTESPRRLPSPPQLQVHFLCQTLHQYLSISSCNRTEDATLISSLEETSEETCRFDLSAVFDLDVLLSNLDPVLSEFGITYDDVIDVHTRIVSNIRFSGEKFGRARDLIHKEESRGLITLQITISRDHKMFCCENCLIGRVACESIAEAEESERVTVPASESSIKKQLKKRVRVEEGESCSICLEEFRGSYDTSMDCSHVFHRECIVKWLRLSHYCPVCRYEMPTDEGGFHQEDELVPRSD